MTNRKSEGTLVGLVAIFLFVLACGDPAVQNNQLPSSSPNNVADMDVSNDVDNTGLTYAEEYQVMFTDLAFLSTSPGASLNSILRQSFDQSLNYPIVVLVDIKDLDSDAGTFDLRAGSGLKTDTDGAYEWDPESDDSYTPCTVDTDSGRMQGNLALLPFVSTIEFEDRAEKVVLNLRGLHIDAKMELLEDGSQFRVRAGTLTGHLTKADGDSTSIALTPGAEGIKITQIFKEERLNFDTATGETVEAGTGDAWYLEATFDADPANIVD